MRILVCKDYHAMSQKAAQLIFSQVTLYPASKLGLATGGTVVGMYANLIQMHKVQSLDFSEVITFNLDEYLGLPAQHPQSYHHFMYENFFKEVNIPPENIHIPNGMATSLEEECASYDEKIRAAGGIDILVLGIGRNAHIGFNEPTTRFQKGTHVVTLDSSTRKANARFFNSLDLVPTQAITMGIGTIFKSRKILLLASGRDKAQAIYNTVYGEVLSEVPSSILQFHKDTVLILDKEAARLLQKKDYKRV